MTAPLHTRASRKYHAYLRRIITNKPISRGGYGQDIFTLRTSYFQGRPPKSVNMFWRRIPVSDIPVDDLKAFEAWLKGQWQIKEDLLEGFVQNGRFPADEGQDSEGIPAINGKRCKVQASLRLR